MGGSPLAWTVMSPVGLRLAWTVSRQLRVLVRTMPPRSLVLVLVPQLRLDRQTNLQSRGVLAYSKEAIASTHLVTLFNVVVMMDQMWMRWQWCCGWAMEINDDPRCMLMSPFWLKGINIHVESENNRPSLLQSHR